ncbi:hypothetical protein SAMN06272735_8779 [Streptomyces sp. TLI_55]|nr:hypothetical protein SAMN06272735_8779 [Streptomyces sp. TLI_55]
MPVAARGAGGVGGVGLELRVYDDEFMRVVGFVVHSVLLVRFSGRPGGVLVCGHPGSSARTPLPGATAAMQDTERSGRKVHTRIVRVRDVTGPGPPPRCSVPVSCRAAGGLGSGFERPLWSLLTLALAGPVYARYIDAGAARVAHRHAVCPYTSTDFTRPRGAAISQVTEPVGGTGQFHAAGQGGPARPARGHQSQCRHDGPRAQTGPGDGRPPPQGFHRRHPPCSAPAGKRAPV